MVVLVQCYMVMVLHGCSVAVLLSYSVAVLHGCTITEQRIKLCNAVFVTESDSVKVSLSNVGYKVPELSFSMCQNWYFQGVRTSNPCALTCFVCI